MSSTIVVKKYYNGQEVWVPRFFRMSKNDGSPVPYPPSPPGRQPDANDSGDFGRCGSGSVVGAGAFGVTQVLQPTTPKAPFATYFIHAIAILIHGLFAHFWRRANCSCET